jgi:hypothetical protein
MVRSFPDSAVACGEEASDPLVLHGGREVRVDELAASGHLEHLDSDLADVARLGVRWWRYGLPWRLTEPAPGEYDWTLWDRALAACERHGLEPVVDLLHFGLPAHYAGFCDGAWVEGLVRYTEAFLQRYPEPAFFTPVNEPMITALCSGFLGIWNDRRASRHDYMTALGNVTLANLEALARIDAGRHPRVVAGHDVYPVSVTVHGRRDGPLTIDERAGAYELEARAWFARYGRPFWVAETSNPSGCSSTRGRRGGRGWRPPSRACAPTGWRLVGCAGTAGATSTTGTPCSPPRWGRSPKWACSTRSAGSDRWRP